MTFRRLLLSLSLLGSLTGVRAAGGDSTRVLERLREHLSPGGASFAGAVYANPAAMPYAYASSLSTLDLKGEYNQAQRSGVMQLGEGARYGSFEATSYLHPDERNTVWGGAGYRFGRTMDVQWNETADFELLYPYVMADSVGGNLTGERYTFAGGYARREKGFSWGVHGDYRALLEYRTADPRPHNSVSDLKLSGGVALDLGHRYALGLGLYGRLYRQTNIIGFYNNQGVSKVYQMSGLGMYSIRFSNGMTDVRYKASGYGVSLDLVPRTGRGFYASAKYEVFSFRRILSGLSNLPLNRLQENTLRGEAGWTARSGRHRWGVKLAGSHRKRTGTEYLYGESGGASNYPKIGQVDVYRNQRTEASLSGLWGMEAARGYALYIEPRAVWQRFESTYLSPQRAMSLDHPGAGAAMTLLREKGRSLWQASLSGDWLGATGGELLLTGLDTSTALGTSTVEGYERMTRSAGVYGASLRWNYRISRSVALCLGASWQHVRWQDHTHGDSVRITGGIAF